MAATKYYEMFHLKPTTTVSGNGDFTGGEGGAGVQMIMVSVSGTAGQDAYVAFDAAANIDAFRVFAGQVATVFDFRGANVKTISTISASGSPDVYVIGIRS